MSGCIIETYNGYPNYSEYLLYMFLNKINNTEEGLIKIILSYYFNVPLKNVQHIYKYVHTLSRFESGAVLVNTVKQITNILKTETHKPHSITEATLFNGIIKSTLKGRVIRNVKILFKFICTCHSSPPNYTINNDFFAIDIQTTDNYKILVTVNPSYEYCLIQNNYEYKYPKHTHINLVDIDWVFKFRKTNIINKYSRFHHKYELIKKIQESTHHFFGLSTFYFWNNIENNRWLNKLGGESSISFC